MSTTRRYTNCQAPLPESIHKGRRRRKFCNAACKQRYYQRHKRVKDTVDTHLKPLFQDSFEMLSQTLDVTLAALAKERERVDVLEDLLTYYSRQYEEMRIDYLARLKGLEMSDEDIRQFNEY